MAFTYKLNKRLICVTLCVFLLFPIFDSNRYDSYAFDVVITPAIAGVIITGLIACGVTVSNYSDFDLVAKELWNSMDYQLKTSLEAISISQEVVKQGVSMWARQTWLDFKASVDSFFSPDGGNVSFSYTGPSALSTLSKVPTTATISPKSLCKPVSSMPLASGIFIIENWFASDNMPDNRGYLLYHFVDDIYIGFGTYDFYDRTTFASKPINIPFWNSSNYISVGSDIQSPSRMGRFYTLSGSSFVQMTSKNPCLRFSDGYFCIINGFNGSIIKKLFQCPSSVGVDNAFNKYVGMPVTKNVSIPYVSDKVYYPTATNSVCPDVPKDKVMSLPLVNTAGNVVALPKDVVGGVSYKDIPVDIPIDPPVVVDPPIAGSITDSIAKAIDFAFVPKQDFLKNKFDDMQKKLKLRFPKMGIDFTKFGVSFEPQPIYIDYFGTRSKIFDPTFLIIAIDKMRKWVRGFIGLLLIIYNYNNAYRLFAGTTYTQATGVIGAYNNSKNGDLTNSTPRLTGGGRD